MMRGRQGDGLVGDSRWWCISATAVVVVVVLAPQRQRFVGGG